MAADRVLPDADARRQAATDFESNLIVLAGAGTGKTSLLVERVLNAIGSGVATMSEIGAITFTEKAAGEMRERLTLGLEGLRSLTRGEEQPDEGDEAGRAYLFLREQSGYSPVEVADRVLQAMEQLDASTVTTIHGFCAELLRSNPLEAGVDPGFAVDSGERADQLLDATWRSFVDDELGVSAARPEIWTRILSQYPLQVAADIARSLAGFNIPAALLEAPWPGLSEPQALLGPCTVLAAEIESLLERQSGMSRTPREFLESAALVLRTFGERGPDAFREQMRDRGDFVTRIGKDKPPDPNKKLDEELKVPAKRLLVESHRLIRDLWNMDDEPARAMLEAVAPYAKEFRQKYLGQGFVDFDGLLSLARDLLRDHHEVREQIKQRYRLLLVDEFQDTDPLQYEIVLFLAEHSGTAAADPYDADLAAGRLFVVGDAKQSIYRFRGADYTAYRRAVDRIKNCGGRELNLLANFRSVPDVTEPVNLLFEASNGCWEESRYQPDYVPIEAAKDRAGGTPRVELWTVRAPGEQLNAEAGREAEGRLIAREIEHRVKHESARYQDFTLLFRSFTSLTAYLRPLRELEIPFVVSGGREFLERPEVTQLMATFRTLARRADQPALLAFLRSPAGAVSDVELAAFAHERVGWDWALDVDAERFPGIARCFGLLRELSREIGGLPADVAFRRILERTLMLPLGAAAFEGAQRVANLQKLTSAASELARDGRLSMEQVLVTLEEGNLELVKTDQPLADDAAEAVRISTMHGMKGLENSYIILPDLARGKGRSGEEETVALTRLPDGRSALGVKIEGVPNSPRVWHDLEDRQHAVAEEVRVLYVALTRASERLILLARAGKGTPAWIEALEPWGYDADAPPGDGDVIGGGQVLHRLLEPPSRKIGAEPRPLPAYPQAVQAYEAAVDALRDGSQAPFVAPSSVREERKLQRGSEDQARTGSGMGRIVGRVLHRSLESWEGGDRSSFDRLVNQTATDEARREGHDPERVETVAQEIASGFFDGELVRRFESVKRLGQEIPLLLRGAEDALYRGSIDLLYEDEDGTVVVADYKTDDETRETELRDHYGEQLRIYAEAAQQALGLKQPPRRELWMLRSGQRIVLS